MKHTKGPWKLGTAIRHSSLAVFDNDAADDGIVVPAICLISPLESVTETDEANAKLIAAAPEMMQTLIDIHEWLVMQADKKHGSHIRLIESAIAKATS